jgi:hypothetical protein
MSRVSIVRTVPLWGVRGTYLPVLPSRGAARIGEVVEIHRVAVGAFGAIARRPPAKPAECTQPAKVHEAAVGSQCLLAGLVLILGCGWGRRRLFGWELGRP